MSRPVRCVLPVAAGIVAAVAILAAPTIADDGTLYLVCNIGTTLDQPAYERCLAELPARQAKYDEDVRVGSATPPVVALAGGMIVALAVHLTVRSRRLDHPRAADDSWTPSREPGPGDIGAP